MVGEASMDGVFRALADPNRRRLLDRLNRRNGQTLRQLCDGLDMARQSVSKHLAVLEGANLVTTARRGREKLHFLNAEPINAIAERWMSNYDRARAAALSDLKHALEQPMTDHVTDDAADRTTDRFVYTTYIRTSAEQLWQALTDPAFTKRYWGVALRSDWQVGSAVVWELQVGDDTITMAGEGQVVLVSEPPHRLAYRWHAITPEFVAAFADDVEFLARAVEEPLSLVRFDIEPTGDVVKLTVTHDQFGPDSVILAGVSQGWPPILASLKSLLETGEPLPIG